MEYSCSIDISRFERVGEQGGRIELDAQWSLYPADRRAAPTIGTSRVRTPVSGNGFAATAGAMSAALDQLAQDIAAAARKMPTARASEPPDRFLVFAVAMAVSGSSGQGCLG